MTALARVEAICEIRGIYGPFRLQAQMAWRLDWPSMCSNPKAFAAVCVPPRFRVGKVPVRNEEEKGETACDKDRKSLS